jgi:hypothetical protein
VRLATSQRLWPATPTQGRRLAGATFASRIRPQLRFQDAAVDSRGA